MPPISYCSLDEAWGIQKKPNKEENNINRFDKLSETSQKERNTVIDNMNYIERNVKNNGNLPDNSEFEVFRKLQTPAAPHPGYSISEDIQALLGAAEIHYLEESENKKFALIQNELIKILSKTPNTYIEQYHLYEKLISTKTIKATLNDFPNMEYKFIMVLRNLSIMSENILIKKENNIFSCIYLNKKNGIDNPILLPLLKEVHRLPERLAHDIEPLVAGAYERLSKKDFIDLELPEKKFPSEQDLSEFDETDDENSKSSIDKKNNEDKFFPTETQVVQFIVDNDIKYFLYSKDYQGNTILHNLIIDCDAERIEKLLKTSFFSFLERNNAGKTPLDLITDVKVSNVIYTILYQDLEYYSYKVNNLEMFIEKVDILFKYTVFSIILICIVFLILIKYF